MKRHSSNSLSQTLRRVAPAPELRPEEDFWSDFKARAALTHQAPSDRVVRVRSGSWVWRAASSAVAVVVLVTALTATYLAPETQHPKKLSEIEEVDIFLEYDSVMIMEDQENGGTVLWLADAGPMTKN